MRLGKAPYAEQEQAHGGLLDQLDQPEQAKARIRAKVEHPFRMSKRQFSYTQVKYRGLQKNTANPPTSRSRS